MVKIAPESAPAQPPAEKAPAVVADKTSSKKQLSEIIDVDISTARLKTVLTKQGVNCDIVNMVEQVAGATSADAVRSVAGVVQSLKDLKVSDEGDKKMINMVLGGGKFPKDVDLESLKSIVSRHVNKNALRVGNDAVVVLTSSINYVVTRLVEHGVSSLTEENKKTLKPHHIANDELRNLDVWCFIRDLECVQVELANSEARLRAIQAKKDSKKKKRTSENDATANAPPAEVVTPQQDVDPQSTMSSNKFKHHVYKIASRMVKEAVKGDVSSDVKQFGSRVVYELCLKYSAMIKILVRYANVKTIKYETVSAVNDILFSSCPDADPSAFSAYVGERMEKYLESVKKV